MTSVYPMRTYAFQYRNLRGPIQPAAFKCKKPALKSLSIMAIKAADRSGESTQRNSIEYSLQGRSWLAISRLDLHPVIGKHYPSELISLFTTGGSNFEDVYILSAK